MTLLSIVQSHCRINGLNVPSVVVASTDTTIIQLLALMNELVEEITDQSNFQGFTKQASWTLIANEDQGTIASRADAGFLWMHPGTFWDRTRNVEIEGPLNGVEWQRRKAQDIGGTYYCYRLWDNHIFLNPAPEAGGLSTVAFEYSSSYGVVSAGGVAKAEFTVDTDTTVLPEKIFKAGLKWKWKYQKGLAYQLDEEKFWNMVNNYIARDKAPSSINLAGCNEVGLKPAIVVPLWDSVPE